VRPSRFPERRNCRRGDQPVKRLHVDRVGDVDDATAVVRDDVLPGCRTNPLLRSHRRNLQRGVPAPVELAQRPNPRHRRETLPPSHRRRPHPRLRDPRNGRRARAQRRDLHAESGTPSEERLALLASWWVTRGHGLGNAASQDLPVGHQHGDQAGEHQRDSQPDKDRSNVLAFTGFQPSPDIRSSVRARASVSGTWSPPILSCDTHSCVKVSALRGWPAT
jgi:hypothetical protein